MFPTDIRILVADDMVAMRKLIKQTLNQLGYRNVEEADDGEQAYRLILEAHLETRPFGLILSDWRMPKMTGIQLLQAVRSNPDVHDTVFLLITAENEFEQVKEAIALGVHDYVVKPFSSSGFKAKLTQAWKKSQEQKRGKLTK